MQTIDNSFSFYLFFVTNDSITRSDIHLNIWKKNEKEKVMPQRANKQLSYFQLNAEYGSNK